MSDKIEYSRLLLKRSNTAGVVPTVPPVTATTLNQFTPTDLFVGEMFANVEDDRAWIRTNNGIIEFNLTGSTGSGSTVIPTLTQVLNSGNTTGGFDILFPSGSKPVYTGLASGGTSQYLGLDASGNTIIVTGATGGSGSSGTSGTSGSSGVNGTSGSSGTSGISGLGLFLPLSGGTVTGNTYFGSTSGITLDQSNSRLGIKTSTPQHTIEAFGTKSKITYEDTSGGVFQISGDTFLPRLSVAGAPSVTKPLFSMSMGVRTYDDVTFPGYGKEGDGHLYASNEMNGLNIINRQGTGTTEDYIRFYAGNDANGTIPDIHIQGSGATKGFVGINTIDPQTELHVSGMTTLDGRVYIKQITSGGSSTYLTIDSNTGQLYTATGSTGASGTSGTSGIDGIFSGGSGNCITDLYVTNIHGCSPITVMDETTFQQGITITPNETITTNFIQSSFGNNGITLDGIDDGIKISGGASNQIYNQTSFNNDVYITNITSGGSSTYLTIDSDTGQLYTAQGTSGGTGTSGTSGSSGLNGSSGVNGTSGTSGTGGGGSSLPGVHFNYPLVPGSQGLITLTGGYQAVAWANWAMRVLAYPVIPAQDVTFSGISLDLYNAAAGGEMRFALYDDNNNKPGSLILTSTTISTASGFAIKQYNTTYTLSAGTRYWLGMGQNGTSSGSTIISRGYQMAGMFTLGTINTASDGYGVNFKYALSNVMPSWPYFPSTFDLAGTFSFDGSYVYDGLYGGTAVAPEIRLAISS